MNVSFSVLTLIFFCWAVRTGLGAVNLVDPPSGSVIANFEGAKNATTLTCNVLNSGGNRTDTNWFLQFFRTQSTHPVFISPDLSPQLFFIGGENRSDPTDPTRTFRNELTILNFTSDLDGVTVFCGTAQERQQAHFFLRVYRPPALQDNFLLRVEENGRIPVNLTEGFAAFPEPNFSWTKDGQPFTAPGLTYSTVTFDSVRREDSGSYNVSATNFILNSTTEQVGNDIGSFYLDVLYGPTLTQGPTQRYVLFNVTLSLVCGTGLDSNPLANVTWTAPDGTTIMDTARYDLENGPDVVRLNFTRTILGDTGTWRCRVLVESEQYIVSNGMLVPQDRGRIGEIIQDIELTVISPPGQPYALSIMVAEATSFLVCWDPPFNFDSPIISFYTINAHNLNSTGGMDEVVVTNTTNNSTFFNMTGLLPGTTYELTVVAVSRVGEVVATSKRSASVVHTTDHIRDLQVICTGSSTAGIIGGAVGGIIAIVIIIMIAVVIIVVVLAFLKFRGTNTEAVYEEPDKHPVQRKSKDVGCVDMISRERPNANENPNNPLEVNMEMEECQAYGKMPNRR